MGTFLICLSLLGFEISTVRTINFAIGPGFIFLAISFAMLGLTSAGSMLSVVDIRSWKVRREYLLFAFCVAVAVLLLLSNFVVVADRRVLNAVVEAAGRSGGVADLLPALFSHGLFSAGILGLFLTVPYFLFGALLSYLFATSQPEQYARLYGADLIGAATGCVVMVFFMETTGYARSVSLPALVAMLAAAFYVIKASRSLALVALGMATILATLPLFGSYRDAVEPESDPNFMIRDYRYESTVSERWSGWNSFVRVGAVEWLRENPGHATLALSNGEGLAYLWPYRENRAERLIHKPAVPAMLLDPAEDALVLLAGAGADMMSLREYGYERVTGVELNPAIVRAGLALPEYRLADFMKQDGIRLLIDEGRHFLARSDEEFDVILLSWSGASAAYYLGALANTTQSLFTYEGLSSILDHLKDDGYAIVLQANKVRMLAALRRYFEERGLPAPERSSIVLYRDGHINDWRGSWDDNPLLIKPEGWSDEEIERVVDNGLQYGLKMAYAPGRVPDPRYVVYERILTTPTVEEEVAALNAETSRRFNVATDDRPFYLDLFDPRDYLTGDFWSLRHADFEDRSRFVRVVSALWVTFLAFVLSVAPLVIMRSPVPRMRSCGYLTYFLLLGAGFMFIEIGMIYRFSIVFGNPGLTIALVLGSIVLFSGVGSLVSNRTFARGLSLRAAAVAIAAYAVVANALLLIALPVVLAWPLAAKLAILIGIVAPGTLVMGHMFPQGIAVAARDDASLVPWAWAINGAMSASVAGIAPFLAQAFGFTALFLVGAALYLFVVFIPITSRAGHWRPESERFRPA